jgi:hypothetical protein
MRSGVIARWFAGLVLVGAAAQAEIRPDPAFGSGGSLTVAAPAPRYDSPLLAELDDGRIVVASMDMAVMPTVRVARFLANGAPDSSFGNAGVSRVPVTDKPWNQSWVAQLRAHSDGRLSLLVTRQLYEFSPPIYAHFLVRLRPDGQLDPAFNGGAVLPLPALATPDSGPVSEMLLQDGAILLLSEIYTSPPRGWFRALRVRADGTSDPAFGVNGVVRGERLGAYASDWMGLPGGAFQVLYVTYDGPGLPRRSLWRRYRADGSVDLSFGNAGEQELPVSGGYVANLFALPDGSQIGQGIGCLLYLLGAEGQLLREFSPCMVDELVAAQPLGADVLLVRRSFFGGTPPPGSPLSMQLIDRAGNPVPDFGGPPSGGWPGFYNDNFSVITDRAGRILIAQGDFDTVRLHRYLDVRGLPPVAVPVPALTPPWLGVLLLVIVLLARRRLLPG